MFGYIMPRKPELKVREWNEYRAEYCGLCKQLQRSFGGASRLFLNYDLLLLALLFDGLRSLPPAFTQARCIAGPLKKRWVAKETEGLAYAAACLVLLSHHKLRDDVADEAFFKRTAARTADMALHKSYRKARSLYPVLDETLAACMREQTLLEKENCADLDHAADPTAQMVAAMAAGCAESPSQTAALFRFGLFLGRIIYFLDAAEDFDKDKKQNRYNVFLKQNLERPAMIETATQQCKMAAAELSASYSTLSFGQNKGLLDNIVYLGLPLAVSHIGCEKQRSIKHDESL